MTNTSPKAKVSNDPVNHPKHYTDHPSGVECIQVTEHMGFNLGNATKYIWRCDLKLDAIEDLKKARWYIDREIEKRTKEQQKNIITSGMVANSITFPDSMTLQNSTIHPRLDASVIGEAAAKALENGNLG